MAATTRELIDADRRQQILDRLGPDPLAEDADPERAWERLSRRGVPIAAALLDQQHRSAASATSTAPRRCSSPASTPSGRPIR